MVSHRNFLRVVSLLPAVLLVQGFNPKHHHFAKATQYANSLALAASRADTKIFVKTVAAAKLEDIFSTDEPATVFIPSDNGFKRLLTELNKTEEDLLADDQALRNILSFHVYPEHAKSGDLAYGSEFPMLAGGSIVISRNQRTFSLVDELGRDAHIIKGDLTAGNTIVHIINKVLLPRPT
mmetsp:Transcript_21664/g.47379  ORF Transcript_21664/g.47379 Transcript_21664/m.47379 type:complete len:180 (-) Transcript_21664:715-1254(-)